VTGGSVLPPDLLGPEDLPARFGPFTLRAVLGEGGMARVFRARADGADRDVALKVLRGSAVQADPGLADAVAREAALGARLQHPNLVRILEAGSVEAIPWLAMELIEGGSLADALAARGPVPVEEAFALARGIAEGLACLHGLDGGVVHRDLKPANVLLDGATPKVADYGLAVSMLGDAPGTWSRAVEGTPAYMSPEQARGERLDGRSDLFALGAILVELLLGERFLPGEDFVELTMALVRVESHFDRLDRLDRVAEGIAGVLRRCLRADPADRWPDAASFAEALAALTPRGGVLRRRPPPGLPPAPPGSPEVPAPQPVPRLDDLDDLEQVALARLTVFVTPCTPEAAAQVVAGAAARWGYPAQALVTHLVERGLLLAAEGGRLSPRPGLRAAADRQLLPSERREAEGAHARWFARFGTDEERAKLSTREAPALHDARRAELPDVRAAMARTPDGDVQASLALSVVYTLRKQARWGEIEELLDAARPSDPALQRRLAWIRGAVLRGLGRPEASRELLTAVASEAQAAGDALIEAEANRELWYLSLADDAAEARRLSERRLMLFSRLGMRERAAASLCELAMSDRRDGLGVQAAARFEEALAVLEASGDPWSVQNALINMWPVLVDLGQRARVRAIAERAVALADQLGDEWLGLHAMSHQCSMLQEAGRLREALSVARRAAERFGGGEWRLAAWVHGQAGEAMAQLDGCDPAGDRARGMAMLDEVHGAFVRRGDERLAGYVELRRVELLRQVRGDEDLRERARRVRVSMRGCSDIRGQAEATLQMARCAHSARDDDAVALAEVALTAARTQSAALTCRALVVAARAHARSDPGRAVELATLGARLSRRTECAPEAVMSEEVLATVDPSTTARAEARARAAALRRELDLPEECLLFS
jgi:tetratricopeptide (TPR) repeat protein